jgi:isoleucyl-tRNA synthetase
VLERWRERDISSASRCAAARGPRSSSSTRARRPRTAARLPPRARARVQGRLPALQDDARAYVERKGGWDCHGLPVEIAVEQQLGFTSKDDIERYGIAEFNAQCREAVFEYLEDWNGADGADRLLGRPRRTRTARSTRRTSSRSGGR